MYSKLVTQDEPGTLVNVVAIVLRLGAVFFM